MKKIYIFIISSCLFIAATLPVHAQTGCLDNTFGSGGIVSTPIGSAGDYGYSVAIQADGKIVVAGFSNKTTDADFALVRYNSDGSLDATFGSGGKVTTDFIGTNDVGNSVAIQVDGKILIAGYTFNGSNHDLALTRYNSNGSLDTTFGTSGKVTTAFGSYQDYGNSMIIQPDNKIVVAGYSYNTNGATAEFALVRYNSDGTYDGTFGSAGIVTTDFSSGDNDIGNSVVLQPDGKIIVGGYSGLGVAGTNDFAIARYESNGNLDNTFGSNGKVTTAIGNSNDNGFSIGLQLDGKILMVGSTYMTSIGQDFAVVRYNSNGSLDMSFGSGGKVTTDMGSNSDEGKSVVIQPNGKIVVIGSSAGGSAVARYDSTGSLDNTFCSGGKASVGGSGGYFGVIQTDGKIIEAGVGGSGPTVDFGVVRFNPSGNVGIETIYNESDMVSLYPNPATNQLFIETNGMEVSEINIYNTTGNLVSQTKQPQNKSIDISELASGVYVAEIKTIYASVKRRWVKI